jgi:general secretion pathway protein K
MLVRQRGVAVITALLLTTLAITIVASLFWQQQVQVRSIENQRLQLQKQWILRGALDWARLILREDAKASQTDNLDEPWAVPLEETRLDQYVENGRADADASDAALSGSIVDAQSRLNLTNLCSNGQINEREVVVFGKLFSNLQLNPSLAQATADLMAAAQKKPGEAGASGVQPLDIKQVDDLLAVPGVSPEIFNKVKDFIVVLPVATPVNINTASAEVLSATIDTLSLSEATTLVAGRQKAYFRDISDFANRLTGKSSAIAQNEVSVSTNYFIVTGNVRLSRAVSQIQSLIERNVTSTKVIWIRET